MGFVLLSCAYEAGRVLQIRPQSHHLWRQTDCLALAWNYYDTTWNFFEPAIHNQFADDNTSGRSAGEFPILYYLVGMLWRITGPSEFVYRLIELLLHFAGTLALFVSVRRILRNAFWAFCTALLFYASPVLVYYGIGFLTDVPAFDLALIGWWYVVLYAEGRKRKHWAWAVFFLSLAMLLKVTAGMSLVALASILFWSTLLRRRLDSRWSLFQTSRYEWVVLVTGFVAVYAWYAYAAIYNGMHGAKYTFNDLWPIWDMTEETRMWAWNVGCDIIVFQVFDTSVWMLMGVALAALAINIRQIHWQLILLNISLLVGTVLYTLFWFHALDNHDYYFINPMIALMALLVSFLWWLQQYHPDIFNARWSRVAIFLLLLYNVAFLLKTCRCGTTQVAP
ncbi:MAG: glycosyltransferase family 39 protein [Flavobacteriales bacterium]|nr:glycosyltransferase family 39 protein [Flavobacteriales bacterium]